MTCLDAVQAQPVSRPLVPLFHEWGVQYGHFMQDLIWMWVQGAGALMFMMPFASRAN